MTWHTPALALFGLLMGTFAVPAGAQGARKIFICVDMEGITGVSNAEQTGGTGGDYSRARKMMADDANAAIRGAVDGGATEVVVIDSHGSGHNLQRDDLDAPARLISENFRRYGMMEGLDATFDAVFLIGHHAKAGSPVGVIAHTQNGNIRDVQINGRSVGEGGMNTLYAAWHGVPVVMVTGDQIAVAQIQEVATGALGVSVKRAINGRAVELRAPNDVARGNQAHGGAGCAHRAEAHRAPDGTVPDPDLVSRQLPFPKWPRRSPGSNGPAPTRWRSAPTRFRRPTRSIASSIGTSTRGEARSWDVSSARK